MRIWWWWHAARIISLQKIYGLDGLEPHIVEISGDVTDAGQTNDEQGKIGLLSQWTPGRLSLAVVMSGPFRTLAMSLTSCYLNIWCFDIIFAEDDDVVCCFVLLIFIDIYWYLYPGVECYGCAWVCTLRYLRDHQDFTASWVHQLFPTEGIWN